MERKKDIKKNFLIKKRGFQVKDKILETRLLTVLTFVYYIDVLLDDIQKKHYEK